jgi:YHS domain-containing protein
LFRFIVFILLIYLIYKIVNNVRQVKTEKNENHQVNSSPAVGEDLVEDPVCHTYVPVSQAIKKEISGKSYYFCSRQCSEKYLSEKNN